MTEKPLAKWFIGVFCTIMALNILFTLISACLVPGIDTIVYTCSGEDACILQMDFNNRQIRYMKYASQYDNRWMTGEMTGFMAFRLKFLAALSNAPLWFREYSGDGEEGVKSWAMDIYFGNRARAIHGNGDMPVAGKLLISRIESIIKLFPDSLPEQSIPTNGSTAVI